MKKSTSIMTVVYACFVLTTTACPVSAWTSVEAGELDGVVVDGSTRFRDSLDINTLTSLNWHYLRAQRNEVDHDACEFAFTLLA